MADTTKTLTPEQAAYKRIAERSLASPEEFNAAVAAHLADAGVDKPTPKQYVIAAKAVSFSCPRCAGTGMFITMVENGVPKGPGGTCYRCNGKGRQNDADRRRNYGHDLHYMGQAAY